MKRRTQPFRCVLCGSSSMKNVYAPTGLGKELVRCEGCTLLQMHPLPTQTELVDFYQRFDVMGESSCYFRDSWKADLAGTPEERVEAERLQWCREQTADLSPLLDVGSGTGSFLRVAQARGITVKGVDLNVRAAQRSAALLGVAVWSGSVMDMTFEETFSAITAWDVLEHVADPRALVARLHQLLSPGGWIFIETPNEAALLDIAVRALARLGICAPADYLYGLHHLILFRAKTVARLLQECGFESVAIRATETPPSRVFRGHSFPQKCTRLAAEALFVLARLTKAPNKMLVAARKPASSSRLTESSSRTPKRVDRQIGEQLAGHAHVG